MSAPLRFEASRRGVRAALALVVVGAAVAVYGLIADPARTWLSLLVDSFYVLSLGVAAVFFFATQRLTSARWSRPIRRVPEAFMALLPVAAILMIILWFGRHAIFPWAEPGGMPHHHGGGHAGRDTYLQPGFVAIRMATILLIWAWFAVRIRRISLAQDRAKDASERALAERRLNRHAAVFAPIFAFTFSAAAYDWVISLEPDWFSTMFAVYAFAGAFVQGIAAVALTTAVLMRRGRFGEEVGREQLHDLGKMLFAFSTFWAYIWVCQYLLIWYGNIPEEVTYYLRRTNESWLLLFLLNLIINWIVPFFALMKVRAKRSPRALIAVSALVLVGHWLDLYILVMPAKWAAPRFGLIELALAVGSAALIYLIAVRGLARAPLVPASEAVAAGDGASRGGES